jgi:hypothetical protein
MRQASPLLTPQDSHAWFYYKTKPYHIELAQLCPLSLLRVQTSIKLLFALKLGEPKVVAQQSSAL